MKQGTPDEIAERRRGAGHLPRQRVEGGGDRAHSAPAQRGAWFGAMPAAQPALAIDRLDVRAGRAHAVQQASLAAGARHAGDRGPQRDGQVVAVQRNHRDGAVDRKHPPVRRGDTRSAATGLPAEVSQYVPQGRRVWRSLTVDEHLHLAHRFKRGRMDARGNLRGVPPSEAASVQRRYAAFGRRAADARHRPGAAAGPSLLLMDEPTEGLAPIIVEQLAATLRSLAATTRHGEYCWWSRTFASRSMSPTRSPSW